MSEWSPAQVASVDAFAIRGALLLIAKGKKPSPCHVLDLAPHVLTGPGPTFPHPVGSTEFALRWRQEGVCAAALTPYQYAEVFTFYTGTQVKVHHASGTMDAVVVPLDANSVIGMPSTPFPQPPSGEATGYSGNFDFGEALLDAVQRLPPLTGPVIPDWMTRVQVVDSGAEFGGIAGFRRMFVKVRRG